jgi:hypothetical protein
MEVFYRLTDMWLAAKGARPGPAGRLPPPATVGLAVLQQSDGAGAPQQQLTRQQQLDLLLKSQASFTGEWFPLVK